METLLLKMLAVQNEILASHHELLAEVRLLRRAVERGAAAPVTVAEAVTAEQEVLSAQPAAEEPTLAQPAQAAPAAPVARESEPEAAPEPTPAEAAPIRPEPAPVAPRKRAGGMMTMDELTDLGGEFLEVGSRPKTRVRPVDVADLGGSLMDEIKSKNRAKRDAFAEFDRLRRDR